MLCVICLSFAVGWIPSDRLSSTTVYSSRESLSNRQEYENVMPELKLHTKKVLRTYVISHPATRVNSFQI